jgi:hypothetical protein
MNLRQSTMLLSMRRAATVKRAAANAFGAAVAGSSANCRRQCSFCKSSKGVVTCSAQRQSAIDFTVYAAIDVYAIGLLDADARGINGTAVGAHL